MMNTPKHTYAFVVGVEQYHSSMSLENLDGPTRDALLFTEWLVEMGVPARNIFLFLSPIKQNQGLKDQGRQLGVAVKPATEQQVFDTIYKQLLEKKGHLLYFLWGGHGVIDSDDQRRLFCTDSDYRQKQNLNFNSLLRLLKSNDTRGFKHQIFLVDTCASYDYEEHQWTRGDLSIKDITEPVIPHKQYVLFAAKPGETAQNSGRRRTGLFSEAVREVLKKEVTDSWLPDMDKVTEEVKKRFVRLREAGETEQKIAIWIRDWDSQVDRQMKWRRKSFPYPPNKLFIGRDDSLSNLHKILSTNKLAVLSGLPGLGKTRTAMEYVYRYQDNYESIFWARADSFETFTSDLVKLVQALDLPEKGSHDQERIMNAFQSWLLGYPNWLLILDNVEEFTLVDKLLFLAERGCILLTMRSQATRSFAQPIPLKPMERGEGTLFLLRRAGLIAQNVLLGEVSPSDATTARDISKELGGLPLALDQAGAYIEETDCGLSGYQELYRTQRTALLNRRGGLGNERGDHVNDHPESVATTLSLSFQKVEQKNPTAVALLRFCAFLHPDAIPEEIIITGAKLSGPPMQIVAEDPLDLNDAIGILRTYSLIERDAREKTMSIHRLVQDVLIDNMNEGSIKQWIERIVKSLDTLFPRVEYANWSFCERLLPHALVCADFILRYEIVLPQAARLLNHVGYYVFEQARYKEAERLLEQALSIQKELKPDHLEKIEILNGKVQILNDLGLLYCRQHKGEQAEPLLEEALSIQEQLNDPNPGQSLWILGLAYYYQNKDKQAEECYQRALEIRREQFKPDDYRIGTVLQNLALLYEHQGKYKQAEEYYQDALKLFEKREPDLARTLECFAGLYRRQGKYQEAIDLCQQALDINVRYLGPEHSTTAISLSNLAILFQELGRFQEAEQLYQRVLAIYEHRSESEHPDIVRILHLLANLFCEQGRYQEAEPIYQRAIAICEQHLQQEEKVKAAELNKLALLYDEQGRYQEAEQLYRQAIAIDEQLLGRENCSLNFAIHLSNLAALCEDQGNYQQAKQLYHRAMQIRRQVLGWEHPTTVKTWQHYNALLQVGQQRENNLPEKLQPDLAKTEEDQEMYRQE